MRGDRAGGLLVGRRRVDRRHHITEPRHGRTRPHAAATDPPATTEPPETTEPPATTEPAATTEPPATTEPVANPDGTDPLPPLADDVALPIVFVHGFAGSAQQYESQKMRFVANGYPAERIVAFEHDGAGMDIAGYAAGAVATIDAVRAEFGVEQVYLVGHSRGTFVSDVVLADPAQAAKVAKYIAIDGAPCPPAGTVPCLAPNQERCPARRTSRWRRRRSRSPCSTSSSSAGAPEVVDIVPQRDAVVLSGRAVNFPANTGRDGATLEIWAVDRATGTAPSMRSRWRRSCSAPTATSAPSRSRRARRTSTCSPHRVAHPAPPVPPAVRAQQRLRPAAVVAGRRADPRQHQHR